MSDMPEQPKPWENFKLPEAPDPELDADSHYDLIQDMTMSHRRTAEMMSIHFLDLEAQARLGNVLRRGKGFNSWYPAWQFRVKSLEGEPPRFVTRPIIIELLALCREHWSPERANSNLMEWSATVHPKLQGQSPASWILDGNDESVLPQLLREDFQL